MRNWPITSLPEATIATAFVLVFDTVVIIVTLHHMVGTWHLQKGLKFQKTSLTTLMLQQGELCAYAAILVIVTDEKYSIRHFTLHVCN